MWPISEQIYDELRRLAGSYLQSERGDHTLQATALVHEAVLKLSARLSASELPRADLIAAAAQAMRRVLVDHARTRNRLKRGGGDAVARSDMALLGLVYTEDTDAQIDLEDLHAALEELDAIAPDAAKMVDLRFFAGISVDSAAEAMAISPRSAARLWAFARAWLFDRLTKEGHGRD